MVDFPEPECPMMETNSPPLDGEGDAVERTKLHVAGTVDLDDVADVDEAHWKILFQSETFGFSE